MGNLSQTMKLFDVTDFFVRQLREWPEAAANYAALEKCERTCLSVGHNRIEIRFNPARIRSSAAKIDAASIAARPCFLCKLNRPKEQHSADFGDFELLVNPYPIFSPHFTIAAKVHTPQAIAGNMHAMLDFARTLEDMTVFYNGPHSGASAPDHLHFQAVPSAELPLWEAIDAHNPWIVGTIIATGTDSSRVAQQTEGLMWHLRQGEEADVNIYARYSEGVYTVVIIPRSAHRPANYGSATGQTLISPASAEMAGVLVAPRREDFDYARLNAAGILSETGVPVIPGFEERTLNVGITTANELEVELNGQFTINASPLPDHTTLHLEPAGVGIKCNGKIYPDVELLPSDESCSFTLRNVMIGIGFHWQQHEDQSFHGQLQITRKGSDLLAVNRVGIETYLRSVVSSEMNANAPEEFLKAHAVISRSWVMAQVMPPKHLADHTFINTPTELRRWYDRDTHTDFDICADDHCQRYQGCTKASTPQVEAALRATRGEVLAFGNELCDARFSKCCGGVTELFSTCWQDTDLPYLQAVADPYCGRATDEILSTALNNYDRTTTGYYRWRVEYSAAELSAIIRDRSGLDFGDIIQLNPLHRGPSGRIDRLEICGTRLSLIIGKELEIRRTLSRSHLYSSAFTVEAVEPDTQGIPQRWILSGRGWGHGVGLCQIGAAVMAAEGHDYRSILNHYFPGSRLITLH